MFTAVPFGPGIGEYLAWMYYGGGLELAHELFAKHNIHYIPCGITPPEASGWFRKEIKIVQDLKGLKMRFFGLGAQGDGEAGRVDPAAGRRATSSRRCSSAPSMPPSSRMPAMDQKFGFYQVAKFYYFPGWHQQASILALFINQKKWDALADPQKAMIELACGDSIREMIAEGEAVQWKAMKEMRDKHGVKIMRWSPEILQAYEKAWNEVVAEETAKNPNFKKVYDSYSQVPRRLRHLARARLPAIDAESRRVGAA